MCKTLQVLPEQKKLRRELAQFPTGVAVVTTVTETGEAVGMTINSFSSVSLMPALVSWCIDRSALSYAVFARASRFAITVLNDNQDELARRFARKGIDKFSDIETHPTEPVVIPGGCAWFQCETHQRFLLGDHLMLIGKVKSSEGSARHSPMVFARGEFHALSDYSTDRKSAVSKFAAAQ